MRKTVIEKNIQGISDRRRKRNYPQKGSVSGVNNSKTVY
jgi:hypothetical protein